MLKLTLTPDRVCGGCTACCKTHQIAFPESVKVAGKWCPYCKSGSGCIIYENRPVACVEFRCEWLKGMGEKDERPDQTKIVPDYVLDSQGPQNGILQLFEVTEGALGNATTRQWTSSALSHGICVSHLHLSGRRVFFAPVGRLDQNLRESAEHAGFEIGFWTD
jgi:hypothetical protein